MRDILLDILDKYLKVFPEEAERQNKLINYLNSHDNGEVVDWNNFDGHIVAGGFIYAKQENKLLVLYHKDLKMYLYPGGHADSNDRNPLETSKREIQEETGLSDLKQLIIGNEELLPIDIDTHKVGYNERLNLPEHYHFDFRYLFMIDEIKNIDVDTEELEDYKWIDINELYENCNCRNVVKKIEKIILDMNS